MKVPLVSVVIPFYSNKKWLVSAVKSVLEQTYQNYEVLIINDGSEEDISLITDLDNTKVRIFNKENGGPSTARNYGLNKAKGDYIAFLDSDDLWMPEKLSEQVSFMEKTKYKWSQHSYTIFWDGTNKKKIIDTSKFKGNMYSQMFDTFKCQTSTFMFSTTFLMENNLRFPIDKRYGQDIYFFIEAAKLEQLGYVEGNYSLFRIRGSNAGFRANVQLKFRSDLYAIVKDDTKLMKELPKNIIWGYKTANIMNRVYEEIIKKFSISSEKNQKFWQNHYIYYPIFYLNYNDAQLRMRL